MGLLEREHYLDQLAEFLRAATTDQGRTVLISGEAGIGKTALVEQFVNQSCGEAKQLWGAWKLSLPRARWDHCTILRRRRRAIWPHS
jgi:AAA ATPase domain